MSNTSPTTPSFVFGYWKPWEENSNFFDSYLNYTKDVSLVKYGADTVGNYIRQASYEQIDAINQLGLSIGLGMNLLSNQLSDIGQNIEKGLKVLSNEMSEINDKLTFINRNLDIQIEQQKLSNVLLQNIAQLLRVPDIEKERQRSIELGIKFFVNAKKDEDLYTDALEELLKAESLMKQDYFVLHRIGCIYLHVTNYLNPEKAIDYFLRAAKYASVESDPKAIRLVNVLTENFSSSNTSISSSTQAINILAAESYEKAAFCAYVLGQFENAVSYQNKALKYNPTVENRFFLSKYQVRKGDVDEAVKNLDDCINSSPIIVLAVFKEIDLVNERKVIELLKAKNDEIDSKINILAESSKLLESNLAVEIIVRLTELFKKSYEIKCVEYIKLKNKTTTLKNNLNKYQNLIDSLIKEAKESTYRSFDSKQVASLIANLTEAKSLPLEKMEAVYLKLNHELASDKLKIGDKYAGGIVFYLSETGKNGLVCTDKDIGLALWGSRETIGADGNEVANGSGMANTKKIVEFARMKNLVNTAGSLCYELNHNGYTDWYLPTLAELRLIYEELYKKNRGNFMSSAKYWSSTEYGTFGAWYFNFGDGSAYGDNYSSSYSVRAIRTFNYSTIYQLK
jgi:tetratricopeptide (TPR) repeat protein